MDPGLSPDTIRFYERAEVLPAPPRRANGYRDYSEGHVATLRLVGGLRHLGLALDDMQRIASVAHDATCGDLRGALIAQLDDVSTATAAHRGARARTSARGHLGGRSAPYAAAGSTGAGRDPVRVRHVGHWRGRATLRRAASLSPLDLCRSRLAVWLQSASRSAARCDQRWYAPRLDRRLSGTTRRSTGDLVRLDATTTGTLDLPVWWRVYARTGGEDAHRRTRA